MNRWLCLFLGLFLFTAIPEASRGQNILPAQETAKEPAESAPAAEPENDFPGVARVASEASEIMSQAAEVQSRIGSLEETASLETRLDQAEAHLDRIRKRMEQLGDPATLNLDRLLEIRKILQDGQSNLNDILDLISARLNDVDRLRSTWEESRGFWKEWESHLAGQGIKIPEGTFSNVQETIRATLERVSTAVAPLVVVQEELSRLINENRALLNRVDAALKNLRGQTFERTSHSFLNPEFYRQFRPNLLHELQKGIQEAFRVDIVVLMDQGWILLCQIVVVLGTAMFIMRHRRVAQETPEWHFLSHHPWATGVFVAMVLLGQTYTAPPALLRLLLSFLMAVSAAVLIAGIVRNPLKRLTIYLLAGILVLSLALQLIDLPSPLFRLYIALVAFLGVPYGFVCATFNDHRKKGRGSLFSIGLRAGALVCLVAFFAQAAGFSALALRLIDASIKSVFVGVAAIMALRLGEGAIDFFLEKPLMQRRLFVQRYGDELARRCKTIFVTLIWFGAFYHFLAVWGVYDSFAQAWNDLTGFGFNIGQVQLTLAMIFLALLVIYLSVQVSWVLRATLDTQVFPHRNIDRGVTDSIKMLLHYLLIFLGFLLAMSLAGIELKNFAVLAGALGIGIGFGLQNIVNNFVSGLILLFERPVKVGDMVVLDGEWGVVGKIGLRSTVIETFDQSELIVPNSRFISEKVTNWTLSTSRSRLVLPVGVAYGSKVEKVLEILLEAAKTHPLVLAEPKPSPIFVGFGESSLDFELRCWLADVNNRLTVRSELGQYIDRRFREEGVEIPFPQRDLHVRSVDARIFREAQLSGEEKDQS